MLNLRFFKLLLCPFSLSLSLSLSLYLFGRLSVSVSQRMFALTLPLSLSFSHFLPSYHSRWSQRRPHCTSAHTHTTLPRSFSLFLSSIFHTCTDTRDPACAHSACVCVWESERVWNFAPQILRHRSTCHCLRQLSIVAAIVCSLCVCLLPCKPPFDKFRVTNEKIKLARNIFWHPARKLFSSSFNLLEC